MLNVPPPGDGAAGAAPVDECMVQAAEYSSPAASGSDNSLVYFTARLVEENNKETVESTGVSEPRPQSARRGNGREHFRHAFDLRRLIGVHIGRHLVNQIVVGRIV